jgi:phosphatidylglycerophosphate synthase
MALIPVRSEVDYLASNHTKQSLRPQPSLGAQIERLPLPRERFSPLAGNCLPTMSAFGLVPAMLRYGTRRLRPGRSERHRFLMLAGYLVQPSAEVMRVSKVFQSIPILLTGVRAALAPTMLAIALFGASRLQFGLCLVAGFLSDIFDGVLARRLNVASPALRRFDSAADTMFYLAALYSVWHVYPRVIGSRGAALTALATLEILRYAFDWLKFGREASYHMWSSKLWGIALFVAFFSLLACASDNATVSAAVYLGLLADLEGLAISILLREWKTDVPTFVHALMQRRLSAPEFTASATD